MSSCDVWCGPSWDRRRRHVRVSHVMSHHCQYVTTSPMTHDNPAQTQRTTKYSLLWTSSHWNYTGKCIFVFHILNVESEVSSLPGTDTQWRLKVIKHANIEMNSQENLCWISPSGFPASEAGSAAIAVTVSCVPDIQIRRDKHMAARESREEYWVPSDK